VQPATPAESQPAELAQSVSELVTHWASATWDPPAPVKLWENSEGLAIQLLQETVTLETAKSEMPWDRERLARFAAARLAKLPVEHLLAMAMQLLQETGRRERRANRRHLAQARPLVAPARPQQLRLPPVEDSPVPPVRARQRLQCPDPCAFFREIPAARKCNRAARCGGRPIFARYRPQRNRRALAGYDNKRSRSQRKHAHRARPFPIAALDRYRCLLRQIAD
jgi:hypothetical protein